jgi:CHAT domain-containing protein
LENILAVYNGGAMLTGHTATKNSFLQQIPAATVVHLYSHAKADSVSQEPTIYFYDSALNLSELESLGSLDTELIVLFACNTGVGKAIKGEGVFSLARGFAAAGIPSTISALWEIDNKATYNLSELFFRELGKGEPSDVALQKAKLDMIMQDDYILPYYWAGAVLIGKPDVYHPGDNISSINYQYIGVLGLIGTIAAILYLAIRKQRSRKPGQVL